MIHAGDRLEHVKGVSERRATGRPRAAGRALRPAAVTAALAVACTPKLDR